MPQRLPQKLLNQYEPENLPVGWPWRFFSISLVIFLSALLVFLGLKFGYRLYLNSRIQKADASINQLLDTVSKADQEKFANFYFQLVNLKNILDSHILSSKIFPFLEKITNQKVYYSSLNLRVSEKELELEGLADSYGVLGEQLEAIKQSAEVENYTLNQSQFGDNLVRFKATLKLKDVVLK